MRGPPTASQFFSRESHHHFLLKGLSHGWQFWARWQLVFTAWSIIGRLGAGVSRGMLSTTKKVRWGRRNLPASFHIRDELDELLKLVLNAGDSVFLTKKY